MLQGCESICRTLATQITRNRLALTFICDAKDYAAAARVLEPLKTLPQLKACSIRIGRPRDDALRSLFRSVSIAATSDTKLAPFTFMELPRKLRFQILQQTDLGGSGNELVIEADGPVEMRCRLNCAFTKLDCCCPVMFSHVGQSSSCTCRALPMELFLVNQQMNIDATEFLYSGNSFRFHGSFSGFLHILKKLRPCTLRSFRRVSFDLTPPQTSRWNHYEQDWIDLISFIRDNFDVPKLLLAVNTTRDSEIYMQESLEKIPKSPPVYLYNVYISIIIAVNLQLSDLKDFHVSLGLFFDLETELEKWVMGPEYDSDIGSTSGKTTGKKANPVWNLRFSEVSLWHKELGCM